MRRVRLPAEFEAWRTAAREALGAGYTPEQMDFVDATVPVSLELGLLEAEEAPAGEPVRGPYVPAAFLSSAREAAVHREPGRWNLLYRLLWRLQGDRNLLRLGVDDDVSELRRMEQGVKRDLHKMHAFVRFRKVEEALEDGSVREQFVAWYRPEHRVLRLAAPFFAERFAPMWWTILTPGESVAWDPETKGLAFGPGAPREAAPEGDELETLWRSYYGSIFNPARTNLAVMRSEMPVRYWRELPELQILPELVQRAGGRVEAMILKQQAQPSAAPFVPAEHSLPQLRAALPRCEGCALFRCATQVVPGVGPARARLMLVGEQPGDHEDLQGLPFVGPAGGVLQRAMEELRIAREDVYLTNAVKHFKFVQRGKLRLHQNPRMSEISACRPWLLAEIDAVKPKVVLCLGASAAKSLLGGTFALMREHGQMRETPYAERVMATVHPSAVLRARDEAGRGALYRFLVEDLGKAMAAAG